MKKLVVCLLLIAVQNLCAQTSLAPLTVEKIMRDPKWLGTSPSAPYWSADGRYLLFSWNPEAAIADSIYYVSLSDLQPKKSTYTFRENNTGSNNLIYNSSASAATYVKGGDIYFVDNKTKKEVRVTQTLETETNPRFVVNDSKIAFTRNFNVYTWDIATGSTMQLTNFQRGTAPTSREASLSAQEKWLQADQLKTSEVIKERREKRLATEAANKAFNKNDFKTIYTEDKNLSNLVVSPTARFVSYRLSKPAVGAKLTVVPSYVTESGFTTDLPARTKVGAPDESSEFYIYDREKDTVILVSIKEIPGITDQPDYVKDYPSKDTAKKKPLVRAVTVYGPYWNERGTNAVVDIRSADNKDRWLMLLDAATGKLKLLDRQRDEAWIGGPGISAFSQRAGSQWIDENTFWFQSEATGYSHLYKINVQTGEKTALTRGQFEIQQAQLSKDKKRFYITTNEVHPGEQQFYQLSLADGKRERITTMTGAHQVTISPDEKQLAILYSYSNKPWELYLQENKKGGKIRQVTNLAQSNEFKSYAWREPEIVTFSARDGAKVYARLYKPANPHPAKPAVIFVHGAGYLQNVHKWWSQYYREYMFHNLLVDNGYTVLDIDYRGSAGYGRDWRTGIYRHMGGKDLSDHVDGAKYLVQNLGVDPKRIGIYGGSYGGFITLMAMFKEPDVFAAGAGLRSVTDWAHYNHGYTSNILNEPYNDSLAYKRSSPIYYAEGLKGHLLMCHGMVDVNVHFQDIVRLTQRLIELKKENWELAVYPLEDHGFVEPSSWTDEYKRILKLFETVLKK